MTTPEGRQGGVPPGAGDPHNRAGQDGPGPSGDLSDAAGDLAKNTSILTKAVEKLGGWVKSASKASVEGIKGYISGGASQILNDLKSTLTQEILAFGYLGQMALQLAGATSTLFFGAVGFLKKSLAQRMGIDKESKEYIKQMKLAAAEKAKGDITIYNEEMARLQKKWENEKAAEKIQKDIDKQEAKFLKAKNQWQQSQALGEMELLKKKKGLLEEENEESDRAARGEKKTEARPVVQRAPKPDTTPSSESDENAVLEKLDVVDNSIQESSYTIIDAIFEANEKSNAAIKESLTKLNDEADERSLVERGVAWAQAALIAAPGWLTIAAIALGIGSLYGIMAYLVYTRWPEIVGGFNALKEDLGNLRDKVVETIVDKVEQVVQFGQKLVNWANNLLPNFIEWWKMSVPEWMGGYKDTEKQAIKDAAAKAQQEKEDAVIEQQKRAAEVERIKTEQSATAAHAEELKKQTDAQKDQNTKAAAAPAPVVQTNVTGGQQVAVHGAPNANKGQPKSPGRGDRGK